eukprot:gnl/TRDRNA2_/TRDRNA2_174545_c1_seq2.p1 gnl/TRDRNA2_/TRDRNA2_174545_c1~~gnl/TRDRNA2_/TRDRNA2_174545_c1_seq2.p1  ORF type:complete len:167 (+),score=54.58 gnl/TRDRNA2_/TRDRNA2_174545_c1_seq2:103-603(+)
MPMIYSKEEIKDKFKELDSNGDGYLSFDELARLLRRGRYDITDDEVQKLWEGIDNDGDGKVDFDEFVDYIFSSGNDGTVDWKECEKGFLRYVKKDGKLDLKEFSSMCQGCELYGHDFDKKDAEKLFTKASAGKEMISFKQFKKLLKLVAKKKKCPLESLAGWIGAE